MTLNSISDSEFSLKYLQSWVNLSVAKLLYSIPRWENTCWSLKLWTATYLFSRPSGIAWLNIFFMEFASGLMYLTSAWQLPCIWKEQYAAITLLVYLSMHQAEEQHLAINDNQLWASTKTQVQFLLLFWYRLDFWHGQECVPWFLCFPGFHNSFVLVSCKEWWKL